MSPPAVTAFFLHWVGGHQSDTPTLEQSKALMRRLQEDAMDEGYDDFEYSFSVDPMGRLFEGRGFTVQSGATFKHNVNTYSVVYLAGPGNALTPAAKAALSELTRYSAQALCPKLSFVDAHREVYPTQCPGDELAEYSTPLERNLRTPSIDWAAIKILADALAEVTKRPLRLHDRRPEVKLLKQLLAKQGFPKTDQTSTVYGDGLRREVHAFKRAIHHPNVDGTVCGGPCFKAAVTE